VFLCGPGTEFRGYEINFFVFFVVKYIWKELARRQSGGESISKVANGL
jgi:hypothetical protein